MADRSDDRYVHWSEHRTLAALLTELENLIVNGRLQTGPPSDTDPDVVSTEMKGLISDDVLRTVRLDASSHSMEIIDYEHHEIHGGSHFFIDDVIDMAINEVYDMQVTTPNTDEETHFTFLLDAESELEWHIYENVVITNPLADAITPYNNNRNSTNTSDLVIKAELQTNLAAANADTNVGAPALDLKHGIIGAGRNTPGENERSKELILKKNTNYLFRGIANAAGYMNFLASWYEHTPKD